MTQKQIVGILVAVAVVGLLFFGVYSQYVHENGPMMHEDTASGQMMEKKMSAENNTNAEAQVPDTVDGVTADIEAESELDTSALDEEESASLQEMDEDSDSVNNLGTSYDENKL